MSLLRSLTAAWPWQQPALERVAPLEGTSMSLWNSALPAWYAEQSTDSWWGSTATLVDRVWVANRCQKMNAQAVAAMPVQWNGPPGADEPAWVSSPDPNLFPNGIGDALHTVVDQMYGWGFSCQAVTSRYADGYPRTWTVLPSSQMSISWNENGVREYRLNGGDPLDRFDIVQIDRNPSTAAHGTPALRAFAQVAWGLLAAQNQSASVTQGGIPQTVLKSERKLTREQAEQLQSQWMSATSNRNGAPPVLPPELQFEVLSINPADLSLLDTQQWSAQVIANAYGVPALLLNMALTGSLAYQTPTQLFQVWWLNELATTSKRIMDAFSQQMLPRGQWVSQDATDFTLEGSIEAADDPQAPQSAKATPSQQPGRLTAIGGGSP
jgi:HK97 family phage portal protein